MHRSVHPDDAKTMRKSARVVFDALNDANPAMPSAR